MNTRSPIATISYNTDSFLIENLNVLIKEGVIEFYAFISHLPEDDEKKIHKHLFVIPSSTIDTFVLNDRLAELDILHPDLPPLGCIRWVHSKFSDWYMYGLHDKDYLASKGESRKYHYDKSDFIVSEYDYFAELIHTSDFSKYKVFNKIRDLVASGVSFRELFSNGFIPVQQIIQYKKAYNLLKYGDMEHDSVLDRAGHLPHQEPDIMPFQVNDDGEIVTTDI